MNENKRRHFLKNVSAGIGALYLPKLSAGNVQLPSGKKVVCIGAHPDDPESGCGGTLAKLAAAGHAVTIIYVTTGEAGIEGKTHSAAAAIRRQEALNACAVLGAKAIFLGQTDGNTVANNEWVDKLHRLLQNEQPAMVFAHWPLDSHLDHQVASLLATQCWIRGAKTWPLYLFEVCTGEQTIGFHPTQYMDITDVQAKKRQAIECHVSQHPAEIYACGHAAMEEFRGREMGVKATEAFVQAGGATLATIPV